MGAEVLSAKYSTSVTIHRCKYDDADVLMIELPKMSLGGCTVPNLYVLSVDSDKRMYDAVYITPIVKLFIEKLRCDKTELSTEVEYAVKADERRCLVNIHVPDVLKLQYEVSHDHSIHSAVVASITVLDIYVGGRARPAVAP